MELYINRNGEQLGPYNAEEVRADLANGSAIGKLEARTPDKICSEPFDGRCIAENKNKHNTKDKIPCHKHHQNKSDSIACASKPERV